MNRFKKAIAVFLVFVMCLGTVPAFAFDGGLTAAEKTDYKVVAVGDSTANGHGLEDFGYYSYKEVRYPHGGSYDYNYYIAQLGLLETGSENAYPARLARYIQEKHPEYNVEFTNLAISGMRNTELRALIDDDYDGDSYTAEWLDYYCKRLESLHNIDDISALFKEEISSADLITLDICLNSFLDYPLDRLYLMMGQDTNFLDADKVKYDNLAELLCSLTPEGRALIEQYRDKYQEYLESLIGDNMAAQMMDMVVYCFASCFVNITGIVNEIRELNPDARIMMAGAYNPFRVESVVVGNVKVDIRDMMDAFVKIVDRYITTYEPNRFCYSYIDIPENVETNTDLFAGFDTVWDMPPELLHHLIDDIFGAQHAPAASPLCRQAWKEAQEKGVDDTGYTLIYADNMIEYFENVRELGDQANPMEIILVNRFEEFINYILAGVKTSEIDLEGVMKGATAANYMGAIYEIMEETPLDELTVTQKSAIYTIFNFNILAGIGPHFSVNGCEQKYEAAVKAYNCKLPAAYSSVKVKANIVRNVVSGINSAIKRIWKDGFFRMLLRGEVDLFGWFKSVIGSLGV